MVELDPILAAVDFMEERLHAPLKIAEAAEAASYSLFHFCREFSRHTRQTPYEYLMRRRLTQAALDLANGLGWVVDMAAEYQFGTMEGFSRAFRRMFTTPAGQVRQGYPLDPRLPQPRFTRNYLEHLKYLRPIPQKETLPEQTLVGLMTIATAAVPSIDDLWRRLGREVQGRLAENAALDGYGLLLYPYPYETPEFFAFSGLPRDCLNELPETLIFRPFPAQSLVCFEHPAPLAALPHTLDYIFHTWLPHTPSPRLPEMVMLRFPAVWPGEFTPTWPIQVLLPITSA